MKYAVHLYPTARVKVTGIEASSVAEAVEKAEVSVDLHEVLDNKHPTVNNVECVVWDEGPNNFVLVDTLDENGEVIDNASHWLDGEGNPLINGQTLIEHKAATAVAASLFMQELLNSTETLIGIADVHGVRTLADLMYLQAAILAGSTIDHRQHESAALEIATGLPSGKRWAEVNKTTAETDAMTQASAGNDTASQTDHPASPS